MTFSRKLDAWYDDYGRSLPWRGIDDPYRIWLSEIILQQTRIEQGREYYLRFVDAFPTVADLAAASEEQVLRLWQGLGYYSRARNLHAAAQYIMNECGGRFPDTHVGLLKLKGVGRYTAAAIASFAFRLSYPVIDGNVYRFISRLYGIATPVATDTAYNEFESLLLKLIDRRRPDRFNAALMDFGSIHCTQHNPQCGTCPFAEDCVALKTGKVEMLPVRLAKAKVVERYFYYLDIQWKDSDDTYTLMQQRTGKDIWKGLWEMPLIESSSPLEDDDLKDKVNEYLMNTFGLQPMEIGVAATLSHQLTHRTIRAAFIRLNLDSKPVLMPRNMQVLPLSKIKDIPISRLIDKYLHGL